MSETARWLPGSGSPELQSPFVPSPANSLSAVIVSGGKQYRVAPGDRILVDRLAAEPGSEISLGVLLVADGDDLKVDAKALEGQTVTARVLRAVRGPKIDVLRYKSKKRVRVHRGARAGLTALEIMTVAGQAAPVKEKPAAKAKPAAKKKAAPAPKAKAAVPEETPAEPEAAPKPRRSRAKAANEETEDGA
ncbi:MAG TPA: 50S ribosomal protein L21 [Candidatus Dormibacteraeota bacterium]